MDDSLKEHNMRKNVGSLLIVFVLCGMVSSYLGAGQGDRHVLSLKEAMGLAKAGKYNEAITEIKQIIQQKQDRGTTVEHFHLGFVYFKSQQYDSAIDEFTRSTEMDKDSPMAYYCTGMIYEAKAKMEKNKAEAKDFESKALQSWRDFLTFSDPSKVKLESQRSSGVSLKENIKRAKRHIALLEEDLRNE
jgi:tetratricopeptide (TPR) repeat protein